MSAVPVVKKLKELYGTPYLTGYPIGGSQITVWKEKVSSMLEKGEDKCAADQMEIKKGKEAGSIKEARNVQGKKRALIIGEQLASCSLRNMLREEFGYTEIDIFSFFRMEEEFMEANDRKIVEENDLSELLDSREEYQLVAADPLCFPLLPYEPEKTVFLPHTAISSRAFWDKSPNCFGEKGSLYFRYMLKDRGEK